MEFSKKVRNYIQFQKLLKKGSAVIVGVSGGPDSVALIYLLHELRHELGLHLHIAHYNHNLRQGAKRDQAFTQVLAEKLHIPCSVGIWKNPLSVRQGSLEERARNQRIKFFLSLAEKVKAKTIALAHTSDDLAETVLMRILRGTGLQGMRGILPKREQDGIEFIRPLLNFPKEDIYAYLRKKQISFCVDSTNKDTKFFRNKVRLELLPLLKKEYNNNISELLCCLADNVEADYAYLESQAQKIFDRFTKNKKGKDRVSMGLKPFLREPIAIRRMLIRKAIEYIKGDTRSVTSTHCNEVDDLVKNRVTGSIVHLPRGLSIRKDRVNLTFLSQ